MAQAIFYGFVLLAVVSSIIVVTARKVVYSAFALMIALSCVAAFYVYLDADFLAAIQVLVYVGGILVLVLFGVMMTSGRLDMKLRAETGQVVPAAFVGIILFGILVYVIQQQSPWRQTLLLRDPQGTLVERIEAQRRDYPDLSDISLRPVQRRVVLRYTAAEEAASPENRTLSQAADTVLLKSALKRVYVVQTRPDPNDRFVTDVTLERRATSLLGDGLDITDPELETITTTAQENLPEGFSQVIVAREPMTQVLGATEDAARVLVEQLGYEPVEEIQPVIGLGDAVMMGEFLLPFEIVSILLLVALIGAAVISRKGVAV